MTDKQRGCWVFNARIARAHAAVLGWVTTENGLLISPQTGAIFDVDEDTERAAMAVAIGFAARCDARTRQRRERVEA